MEKIDENYLYKTSETARLLNCSVTSVRRYIKSKSLMAVKLQEKQFRVRGGEILKFLGEI